MGASGQGPRSFIIWLNKNYGTRIYPHHCVPQTICKFDKPKLQADLLTPRPVQQLMGMPWTIPNLVLQAKPVPLANMRTHGRRHVFVNCGNPDCYHNAELDVSGLPDNVTFGELQRRMLCTVCDHRGADVGPSWLHHG